MPVFEYRCIQCKSTYDVFHKGKEIVADIVCPSCGSAQYVKLISAPAVSIGSGHADSSFSASSCSTDGGCCGGSCQMS